MVLYDIEDAIHYESADTATGGIDHHLPLVSVSTCNTC
jgi:hypothetical protein